MYKNTILEHYFMRSIAINMKNALVLFCLATFSTEMAAQGSMDFMRSIGKIYVVVAVLVIIFLGFVYYLISIDKRLKKLEKQQTNE